ncbi:PREDICTED: agglutinin-like protein ARB_02240 isoform X5 [Branchiostoma belcheri]|uniref:Agglutinin-like protein ARB_02240 isoform X5 n=1 Tax=Branchiostoma belcheri TaxID=7741 RepID=A0A6P4YZA0_BRABE|nr:PREDICTED: agglutinin-like protein ARB_02240 isoform X5 [Branchiostoma belcheri]
MRFASSILLLFSWFALAAAAIDLDTAGQYKCSFDDSVCDDWTVEGPVNHGGPAGCDHGWPNDALTGATAPGAYVCFFLESLPSQYPDLGRARLTSPTINVTQHVVLGFSVGTVRPPTSTYLRVLLVNETGTNGTETLMCSTSDLLLPFQRIYVGIVQPGPYKIVIEGIPDPPFYPNFGMDELTLTAVENATANVVVQTTTCSTELVTTPRMTTRQYNTTLPMTSSQDDTTMPAAVSQITTTFSQTSSQQPMTISKNTPTTILPTTDSQVDTSSQDTAVLPTTSRPDTTVLPMTSSKDTTVLPKTSSHDTTILPMTDSQDTTVLPMTGSQDTTVLSKTSSHDTTIMAMTSSQDTATLPITTSQDTTHKATYP